MKIVNQTAWRTDHLRALIARVAQDELDAAVRRALRVRVTYKVRRGWRRSVGVTGGLATIGGPSVTLYLPTGETVDRSRFAHTVAHELAHVRGLRHAAMRGSPRYTWAEGWSERYAWADALPLERKASPPKPTAEARLTRRLAHAAAMQARWQHRLKIAQGRVRRWRGRVRDYERHIAAAASPRIEPSATAESRVES